MLETAAPKANHEPTSEVVSENRNFPQDWRSAAEPVACTPSLLIAQFESLPYAKDQKRAESKECQIGNSARG